MNLGGSQSLKFIDLAEPWVKLSVPGPLTGWTPVLGLIEQADDNAALERIWQGEYQSKSRNNHKDPTSSTFSVSSGPRQCRYGVGDGKSQNAERGSSITQSTGQPQEEPAVPELASSAPLERNDYDWLLGPGPKRYTLELFSSTSEMLIREFYRTELFDDHVSYFSSSISGNAGLHCFTEVTVIWIVCKKH
ncbi:MAG: hypothetical protein CM1200mP18_16880 [Gammaproteobacteria bacterium]|nr:MAG: hypothetical protein CM1200mP18_16880 [Gammaproteobacteria bacterium]